MNIDINTYGNNKSDLVFLRRFEVPSRSFNILEVRGLNQSFLSYSVFQLHTFYYNVSLSLDGNLRSEYQNGTNIGFTLKQGNFSQTIILHNDNFDDVQCMVGVVIYNQSAPIIGDCSKDENPTLNLEISQNFIILKTPLAKSYRKIADKKSKCEDIETNSMDYSTYYLYLDPMNFDPEIYFDGIKSLMFDNALRNGEKVKK